MNWKNYQEKVAEVFRKAGCDTKVEAEIEGVRGKHKIDVFVRFEQYGINCSWVVECKCWNASVPKEKVLALQAIVDDVGADRGVLISKRGFQSGAIRFSKKTNITLTSLEDLREDLRQNVEKRTIETLEANLLKIKHEIFDLSIPKKTGENTLTGYYPEGVSGKEAMEHGGRLSLLEMGFANIKLGKRPFPFRVSECGGQIEFTDSIEEFLKAANSQISITTSWLNAISSGQNL